MYAIMTITSGNPVCAVIITIRNFFFLVGFAVLLVTTTRSSSSTVCIAFSGPMIALNVKVSVKPERRQDFLAVIQKDAEQTLLTEPGALQFTVGEDVEKENVFYFHEQYKTMEDVAFHKSTSHFLEWTEFQKTDPFSEALVVDIFQCDSNSNKNINSDESTLAATSTPNVPIIKPSQQPVFCLNVQLCIQPQVRDEFLKVILNNQKGSREEEPLCLQYDFGENVSTHNVFHFHEQYVGEDAGKEGFHAHQASPHFAVWEEFAAKGSDVFTKDPVINFYRTIF